jgi:hypothetical protein
VSGSKVPENELVLGPEEIRRVDEILRRNQEALLRDALSAIRDAARMRTLEDLWHRNNGAMSHWILILNGTTGEKEQFLAKEVLFWREVTGGPDARVRCVQSSERQEFAFCAKYFGVTGTPTLIVSDSPACQNALKIDGAVLSRLADTPGAFSQFMTSIHMRIISGSSLSEINDELKTQRFWEVVKIVYKEVKDLVSLKISVG